MVHLLLGIIYLAFISLGLPDSLLGSAWPMMYQDFQVPVSYAGVISMIIAVGTVVSSLQSDRLTKRFGTGRVTAFSVAVTAVALMGFSFSHSFWMLCIIAIPYGLGAGSVDASLNNYVALHYASRHMSWLHCMWGVGASIGPYIMGYALSGGQGWNAGYRYIAILQIILTAILFLSLPLWKSRSEGLKKCMERVKKEPPKENGEKLKKALTFKEVAGIPGVKAIMITFFCYCALEQTTGLWASSYLVMKNGFSVDEAAKLASLFFLGITIGRAIGGFLTIKLNDKKMVHLGEVLAASGVIIMLLPFGNSMAMIGLVLIGLGCAPIYPCIIHATPLNFGVDNSQAIIGVEMASAYIGTCVMPPLFGGIAGSFGVTWYPIFLLVIIILMIVMYEIMNRICSKEKEERR